MEIAMLTLDYVRTLVWPAAFLLVLMMFRSQVRALLNQMATHSADDTGELRESAKSATRKVAVEQFRRISGFFVSAPHPIRVQAANELASLAPLLSLEELFDIATSPHPGERVGAAIGLGIYSSDSITAREDARMEPALRSLLIDHFSRVRFRAVEALGDCPDLIAALRPELHRLADTDPNDLVKKTARKMLARSVPDE